MKGKIVYDVSSFNIFSARLKEGPPSCSMWPRKEDAMKKRSFIIAAALLLLLNAGADDYSNRVVVTTADGGRTTVGYDISHASTWKNGTHTGAEYTFDIAIIAAPDAYYPVPQRCAVKIKDGAVNIEGDVDEAVAFAIIDDLHRRFMS